MQELNRNLKRKQGSMEMHVLVAAFGIASMLYVTYRYVLQDVAHAVLERTVYKRDVGKVSVVESCGDTWADAAEDIITKLRNAGAKRGQVLSIDARTSPDSTPVFSAHFSSQMEDKGPLDAQFIQVRGGIVQAVARLSTGQTDELINEKETVARIKYLQVMMRGAQRVNMLQRQFNLLE